MIVERNIFQVKFGKGDEVVSIFKEVGQSMPQGTGRKSRLLTDRSGQFFTVVLETEWESLAEWEKSFSEMFSDPAMGSLMARTTPLIESGRREFFYIEVQMP